MYASCTYIVEMALVLSTRRVSSMYETMFTPMITISTTRCRRRASTRSLRQSLTVQNSATPTNSASSAAGRVSKIRYSTAFESVIVGPTLGCVVTPNANGIRSSRPTCSANRSRQRARETAAGFVEQTEAQHHERAGCRVHQHLQRERDGRAEGNLERLRHPTAEQRAAEHDEPGRHRRDVGGPARGGVARQRGEQRDREQDRGECRDAVDREESGVQVHARLRPAAAAETLLNNRCRRLRLTLLTGLPWLLRHRTPLPNHCMTLNPVRGSSARRPIRLTQPIANVRPLSPEANGTSRDARWTLEIEWRWMFKAPDRLAPGMARAERPGMACSMSGALNIHRHRINGTTICDAGI